MIDYCFPCEKKDAVFTFNWDPFLFDSYKRNFGVASLPAIFFLHGNVRIGACTTHKLCGGLEQQCPRCKTQYSKVPLLYPIENKDYTNDPFIAGTWKEAKGEFANAFTITIFGYSAPTSDNKAKELIKLAWLSQSDRALEHIEVIDIEKHDVLFDRWQDFTPTYHFHHESDFAQSRLWKWPRRSCESLFYPMTEGLPCEAFPLPVTDNLKELHKYIVTIARQEQEYSN